MTPAYLSSDVFVTVWIEKTALRLRRGAVSSGICVHLKEELCQRNHLVLLYFFLRLNDVNDFVSEISEVRVGTDPVNRDGRQVSRLEGKASINHTLAQRETRRALRLVRRTHLIAKQSERQTRSGGRGERQLASSRHRMS